MATETAAGAPASTPRTGDVCDSDRLPKIARRRRLPGLQRLYVAVLRAWFRRVYQRRQNRPVLEEVHGTWLLVLPGVLNPKLFRTGAFLAQTLLGDLVPPGARVLDMGTGTGVGAVFAARRADRVLAVDINPAAVRCARLNARLHALEHKIEVRQSDLFEALPRERFDVVLFNPPYLKGTPRDAFEGALFSPDVIARFLTQLPTHLEPNGRAYLLLSTVADLDAILADVRKAGFTIALRAEKKYFNETLVLFELRRREV